MNQRTIGAAELERVGRTFIWKDIVWCGLSGTGIRFMTDADKVTFHLIGDSSTNGQETEGLTRAAVFVDDVRQCAFMMENPEQDITVELASVVDENAMSGAGSMETSASQKLHKVQFVKLSECAMSGLGIAEVQLESQSDITVAAVEAKAKKMEFIGDSITCGYGIDMEDPLVTFRTDTEDCTLGYAYQTAQKLGTECQLVSFSGYGIITGYTETDEMRRDQLVPSFYEKCGFSYAHPMFHGEDGPAFESVEWDFTSYVPDVVVVNLGTNDHSYCGQDKTRLDWYKKDYKAFLQTIRKYNPMAKILCCLGLMEAGDNVRAVKELVDEYQKETGDNAVFFLELPLQKPENGLVSDYHPTRVSHNLTAELVTQKITQITQK